MTEDMLEAAIYEEQLNTDELWSKWKPRLRLRPQISETGAVSDFCIHLSAH